MVLESKMFTIDLTQIFSTNKFALLDVNPIQEYVNGQRTDKVIGTRYSLADAETFKNFDVKVSNPTPIVNKKTLENSPRIWVSLENAKVMPYSMKYGKCECTITANEVKVVK